MNSNIEYSGNRLSYVIYNRRKFDPTKQQDIQDYKYFLDNNHWKNGCPFWLEWPYLTIPDMIKDSIVRNLLK